MIIIEKSGKTIDEAVSLALQELNTTRENVEIEVINEGKRGILGLGAEDATVRVKMEESPLSKAENYIKNIMESFGINAELKGSYEGFKIRALQF